MKDKLDIIKKIKYQLETNSNMDDVNCGNRMHLTINNPNKVMHLVNKLEKSIIKGSKMRMNFLSKEELIKLNTKRLLAYKAKLMKFHDTPDDDAPDSMSKQHPEWKQVYADVKAILSTRENVK